MSAQITTEEARQRVQHAWNKIQYHVPEALRKGRFLDIGCGTGNGLLAALSHGASLAIGVDCNLREFGDNLFSQMAGVLEVDPSRATLIEGDLLSLKFEPAFDYVLMLDVIEHVPNPDAFRQYAYRSLCPGGVFVVDTCPLYYSSLGHHLFGYFPKETLPWVHLYGDFEEVLRAADVGQWSVDRFRELNKVTHAQIRHSLLKAGFTITLEHRDAPTEETLAMYERAKDRLDAAKFPGKEELFEEWTLFVAQK